MKGERLYISKLFLFVADELHEGIQDDELIFKTTAKDTTYYTPGTAYYEFETKSSASGVYFINTIVFSMPGLLSDEDLKKIHNTKAIVAEADSGNGIKKIVFYKNDYFSNSSILAAVSGSLEKTQFKFSLNSLYRP